MPTYKNPLEQANDMIAQGPTYDIDEEGVGTIIKYKPWIRVRQPNENDDGFDWGDEVRARKLNNGLAVETKKYNRPHIYGGQSGNYKIIDVDSGLMAGWANSYEDALKLSKTKEYIDKVIRARESLKRHRYDD